MPWTPTDQQKTILKNQIKTNFKLTEDDKIDAVYKLLLDCKGKAQAEAVVTHCTTYDEVRLLRTAGFTRISANSREAIQGALIAAPSVITQAKAAAALQKAEDKKQADLNDLINGYLVSLHGKYIAHRNGTYVATPVQWFDGSKNITIGGHYNNGEGILPAGGNYIEWYPIVGGKRSAQRRFFTRRYESDSMWYTVGGTHGSTTEWYLLSDGNWTKRP
jgi:hypothetical protein